MVVNQKTSSFYLFCLILQYERIHFRIPLISKLLMHLKGTSQVVQWYKNFLKEINPEYSSEGLKLNLQSFGPMMRRVNSLEKTLMLRKIEGRRRGQQRMTRLDGITDSMAMILSEL